MTSVPMFNLSNVTDVEKLTEIASSVLNSSQHILGQNVTDFERVFANYIGVKECIGVANGSDALVIALRALGVNRNDEVATVANAGFYTCAALNQIGAQPIFIDIDASNFGVLATDLNGDGVVDNSDLDNVFLSIDASRFSDHP